MKKIEFKKIESLLEDILNDKNKVIDLIAVDNSKQDLPFYLFEEVDAQNSVFINSKASLFIGLYIEVIKIICNIDFDSFKNNNEKDNILKEETVEDIIIDMGTYVKKMQNKKENTIIKKYKSHIVYLLDIKNILKWFEVCRNNNLKVHII
jgi:hypothetical protein